MAYAVPYTTLSDVKAMLTSYQGQQDSVLTELINVASLWIDRYCKRPIGYFLGSPKTKYFDIPVAVASPLDVINVPSFNVGVPQATAREIILEPDGLLSITSLKTDPQGNGTFPDTWVQGLGNDFLLYPLNAAADGRPYKSIKQLSTSQFTFPAGPSTVQVVGVWGEFTAVPDDVAFACRLQVIRWFKRPDAPFGVTGPSGGRVSLTNEMAFYFRKLDPDVEQILQQAGLIDQWLVA